MKARAMSRILYVKLLIQKLGNEKPANVVMAGMPRTFKRVLTIDIIHLWLPKAERKGFRIFFALFLNTFRNFNIDFVNHCEKKGGGDE